MDTASNHGRANTQEFWSRFVQPRVAHIQSLSPLGSTNLVRDARQTLNDELAAMHAAMCTLRTHLNALSLMSSLPPEVLAHIFKLVVANMKPFPWVELFRKRKHLGWIRTITHVCRHWRDIALSTPILWSDVDEHLTPQWRKLMINRAKRLPLTMDLGSCDPEENAFLAKHAFHTCALLISAPQRALKDTCKAFTSSADILEHLSLRVSDKAGGRSVIMLPTNIFAGHTPSLRRVTLYGVVFSWGASIFRNLTHLRVSLSIDASVLLVSQYARLNRTYPTSQYDHFLDVLAHISALKTLELIHCIPSRSLPAAERLPIILPCLELISLADTLKACVDVIQHLTIPASTRFLLKCTTDPHPIDGLVRFFDRHANGRDMPPLLTLFVSQSHLYRTDYLTIDLWQTRGPSISSETRMGCRPTEQPFISIEFPPSPDPLDQLERLGGALPLEDLRTLKVVTDPDSAWLAEAWIDIFGRCRRVEHLSVQGWNGVYFCKALARSADGAASADERALSAGQQLFFRRLKSLEVCTADLLSDPEGTGRPWISSLKSWLSIREDILNADLVGSEDSNEDQSGEGGMDEDVDDDGNSSKITEDNQGVDQDIIAPRGDMVRHVDNRLKRLLITDCSVMAKHVEQLKPVVQELLWDRCEGIWESASEDDNNYDI